MKILFNTHQTAFQTPGGGEIIILKLKEYLEKCGVQVDLFNPWENKITDYDIVHLFSTIDWPYWKYFNLTQVPFVVTPTMWPNNNLKNVILTQFKAKLKNILSKEKESYSLYEYFKFPDLICPTTQIEADKITSLYKLVNINKIKVLGNGVDIHLIKDTESENTVKKDYVLFVGNLAKNKNLDVAIKITKNINKKLKVVGDYNKENLKYKAYIESLDISHVEFIGKLKENSLELIKLYKESLVVLIPSEFETCSLVGLEAGALGTPVVITKYGGTKEVFKEYVEYIDPHNDKDIMEKMNKALQKNGTDSSLKSYIQDNFSWSVIAQNLLNEYNRLKKDNNP